MPYCNINYIPQTTSFNSTTVEYKTPYATFVAGGGHTLNLIANKSSINPAEIFLVSVINDVEQEYNLSNISSFSESMLFYIKIMFNGTTESFDINIINTDCDTIFYPLSFYYES
jgi:hypothetical protein